MIWGHLSLKKVDQGSPSWGEGRGTIIFNMEKGVTFSDEY